MTRFRFAVHAEFWGFLPPAVGSAGCAGGRLQSGSTLVDDVELHNVDDSPARLVLSVIRGEYDACLAPASAVVAAARRHIPVNFSRLTFRFGEGNDEKVGLVVFSDFGLTRQATLARFLKRVLC